MKKMRAYANVGRLRLNMLLKREVITNFPVKAYIEPTLFCNLRCPACPTGLQLGVRPSSTLSFDLFKSAIDEMADYLFVLQMYNWGEPLLHRQTPEMIRYARDKNIENIRLSTNLSLNLTDDYIERLVRSGLTELIVSLDGTSSETYSKYRVRGEFDLVSRNMMRIQEAKTRLGLTTPEVVWQFLVFKHNEHEIGRAQAEYREWGADRLDVFGAEMPEKEYAEGFEPSTIPAYNQYHPDHPQQLEMKRYKKSGKSCSWLYGVLVLNPNGKVSSCCSVVNQGDDFGEYSRSDGLFKAWNSKRFQRARALFTSRKPGASVKDDQIVERLSTNGGNNGKASGHRKTVSLPVFKAPQPRLAPSNDPLICHSCPIPYRMNEALDTVNHTAATLLRSFHEESSIWKRARLLSAYLLMGAPGWKVLLRSFLSFRARNFRVAARTLARGMFHSVPRAR
jgi:MoaA/NifB/PqqE/SkfB family radical SAM enzyme